MAEKGGIEELRVKEILKERGIKMKELAEKMGKTPESLTRALQRNPQYSTLKAIAQELGLSMRDLFKEEREEQKAHKDMQGCIFHNGNMFIFNSREELDVFLKRN